MWRSPLHKIIHLNRSLQQNHISFVDIGLIFWDIQTVNIALRNIKTLRILFIFIQDERGICCPFTFSLLPPFLKRLCNQAFTSRLRAQVVPIINCLRRHIHFSIWCSSPSLMCNTNLFGEANGAHRSIWKCTTLCFWLNIWERAKISLWFDFVNVLLYFVEICFKLSRVFHEGLNLCVQVLLLGVLLIFALESSWVCVQGGLAGFKSGGRLSISGSSAS